MLHGRPFCRLQVENAAIQLQGQQVEDDEGNAQEPQLSGADVVSASCLRSSNTGGCRLC